MWAVAINNLTLPPYKPQPEPKEKRIEIPLTDEEKELITVGVLAGDSYSQIARDLGRPISTVRYYANHHVRRTF